jgi:tetratricopeptide (TPR) repeat protein
MRAGRLIGFGDSHFTRGDYRRAADQYEEAVSAAPDLADAHYRLAYAQLGQRRYDQAVDALKVALQLDPAVPERFQLQTLYPDRQRIVQAQLDKLAEQALEDPRDTEPLVLIGLLLHDQGQPERAAGVLQRALELLGPEGDYLMPLVPETTEGVPVQRIGPGQEA